MANYSVRAIGADFEADDQGSEYISADVAKKAAVKAAVAIAADEIDKGKNSSIIETHIKKNGQTVSRYLVVLSVEAMAVSSD